MFDSIRHAVPSGGGLAVPGVPGVSGVDRRVPAAGLVVALALWAELRTPVPGLRLLLAVAVVYAPAFVFERFWRGLLWLGRGDGLDRFLARRGDRDWRGRRTVWLAFATAWFLDLVATVSFFFHPYLRELHPLTVFLYDVAGIPGVVVAAASYAGVVVAVTRALASPTDFDFLLAATLWYALLVFHNAVLLLGK